MSGEKITQISKDKINSIEYSFYVQEQYKLGGIYKGIGLR